MAKTKLIPGFRFHPTDLELLRYFLKRKVMGKKLSDVIAEVDIYKYAPWDLPDKSCLRTGDLEWYFFCPREKKYASGARVNRATEVGYWKTTGRDRPVHYNDQVVGMIKTLVFHRGRAPRGDRTDWVMHEFRLEDKDLTDKGIPQNSYVLCKVFQKDGPGPRNGAQYGKPFNDEDWDDDEEIDGVGSIPLVAMSSPIPILPITLGSSIATGIHPPASACIASPSESSLSRVMPSSPGLMHPSVPSDQVISNDGSQILADDIVAMLGCFTENNTVALNENNIEKIDNSGQEKDAEVEPCVDVNDIFKDLGDLHDLAGWRDGHRFSCGQKAEYNTNQMFPTGSTSLGFDDPDYLELLDLDSPLFQQTEHESRGPFDPEKEGL